MSGEAKFIKLTKLCQVLTLVVGVLSASTVGSFAYAQEENTRKQPPTGIDQIFTHPTKGFQVLVPADASLIEGQAGIDLAMGSRQGWSINIQSAQANPNSTVNDMVARLEAKYLGKDKPWSQKISGRNLNAYGQPGYDGVYDGSGMKVRVVLLRTDVLDYVVMFIAPSGSFLNTQATFDRVLSSFIPSKAPPSTDSLPTNSANSTSTDMDAELIQFHDNRLGYSMVYPSHWNVNSPTESTRVFSGPQGTKAALAAVSVQNVAPPRVGTSRLAVEAVIQELRNQMAYNLSNIHHAPGRPFFVQSPDGPIQVTQFVSDYRRSNVDFRQWTIAIPRHNGAIVHVWTYIAPLDRFELFQDTAQRMAGSWTIQTVTP